ncbi:MAG: 3-phosphoshikimate 1-carboxyvinyltransferase, partial [Gammaproteobacteria bacterium]
AVTRDHTERMLANFGIRVTRDSGRICVTGGKLSGQKIHVPGDISSAAFFLTAASIVDDSDLLIRGVGINPTRAGVIDILRSMGAQIDEENRKELSGEPVADLRVRHRPLHGIRIPRELVSIAIDEFPAILIAAACASGETVLDGAAELRVKESDRIEAMAGGLRAAGIEAYPAPDGIRVRGGTVNGCEINSRGDHRIAMAFAIAGLAARGPVRTRDCANVNTSFPGFVETLRSVGGDISRQETGHG